MNATLPNPLLAPLPQTQGSTTVVVQLSAEDRYIESKIDVLNWVLTVLAGTVVGLRIYNKFSRRLWLWWDDYIMIVSWTLLLAFAIVTIFEVRSGIGRHITNLSPGQIREFALLATVSSTLAIMVTALARVGFAVSLLRVAEGWPRRFTWAVIFASNIVSGLAGLFLWVQCTPIRKNWDSLDFGYCWAPQVRVAIPIINTAVGGFLNVFISLVGLYIVRKNTAKQRDWVGALVLTALAIFAGIASWVKTSVMHILIGDDVSFDIVTLVVWGMLEPAVIIIAGSLPELRSFVWRDAAPSGPYLIPFTRRRNGIQFDADFEFARQQYLEAGGKTVKDYSTESKKSWV
ncbi:hypothetical protein Daus18300_003919 [Diaporthe australafricana]|uniref:Rhodopsin domain-containing protein n=1 Tax=Diaporthe australafricana TaxID=127596 RepID=A0ABR3XD64_9PEZI